VPISSFVANNNNYVYILWNELNNFEDDDINSEIFLRIAAIDGNKIKNSSLNKENISIKKPTSLEQDDTSNAISKSMTDLFK